MREIKFRAWDSAEERMIYSEQCDHPFSWIIGGNGIEVMEDDGTDWNRLKNLNFMQYIGLKDKNGIEIYEGDIIRVFYKDKDTDKDSVTGIIFYDTSKSKFDLIYYAEFDDNYECDIVKKCFKSFDDSNIDNFEIIGNIHEKERRGGCESINKKGRC